MHSDEDNDSEAPTAVGLDLQEGDVHVPQPPPSTTSRSAVPVTLITGRQLTVDCKQGERTAVGEWVELANGCLCCSVKDNFVQALEGLMDKRHKFDNILIETTGLANPAPIASALWTDEELEADVVLDAVVTVVDAVHIARQLEDPRPPGTINEAQSQIAYADIVLLNKVDLATTDQLSASRSSILAINPTADLMETQRCMLDLGRLLNCRRYRLAELAPGEHMPAPGPAGTRGTEQSPGAPVDHPRHDHDHEHGHEGHECGAHCERHHAHEAEPHRHDDSITSVSLRVPGALHLDRFRAWVESVLWERQEGGPDVLRAKGVLRVHGSMQQHMFQAVYELYDVVPGPQLEDCAMLSRLVLIGRHLDRHELQRGVTLCAEDGPAT